MTTQKVRWFSLQALSKIVRDLIQTVAQPALRIFSPTHDDYPEVGVQPYEGDPADKDYP
jgi:hypothetical protein